MVVVGCEGFGVFEEFVVVGDVVFVADVWYMVSGHGVGGIGGIVAIVVGVDGGCGDEVVCVVSMFRVCGMVGGGGGCVDILVLCLLLLLVFPILLVLAVYLAKFCFRLPTHFLWGW
jgi:hypothetical protein